MHSVTSLFADNEKKISGFFAAPWTRYLLVVIVIDLTGVGLKTRLRRARINQPNNMRVHPSEFEVFKNLFVSIAEEMGVTLCRTGFSPNIKERLDYSCAVYDSAGETI